LTADGVERRRQTTRLSGFRSVYTVPRSDEVQLMKLASGCFSVSRDNGLRGYAERSRRERTWDPGSAFYAEGASKHHTRASLPNGRRTRGANRAPSMSGVRNRRPRSRGSMDVHPVDMDWEKVTDGRRNQ